MYAGVTNLLFSYDFADTASIQGCLAGVKVIPVSLSAFSVSVSVGLHIRSKVTFATLRKTEFTRTVVKTEANGAGTVDAWMPCVMGAKQAQAI